MNETRAGAAGEVRLLLCAALLACGVSAATAAVTVRMAAEAGPRVAGVRLAELAAEHGEYAAHAGVPAEEISAATRAWAAALEVALGEVASRHGAVLLPARAVAAGAPDLTADVRARLDAILKMPASAEEVRR